VDYKIHHYHIQSELGRGGMATVYLAHDSKFDTNVAIKVLNKEFVHNENIRKRFLAEAKNMFKMSHPNIIKVTDLIEENDTVAFVMEYIEGETLKEYLDRKGKLKDDEIKNIFSQMLEAVGYVHEQNLVHRDIKPSNFMIDKKGKVKLMDFGIAKSLDPSSSEYTQTGTGMQMGTPMYMSPEQIKSTKEVTYSADIYSLGVVLWQMVAGRKPYDLHELSVPEIQVSILKEPLPNISLSWDGIIQKCTQKDIARRFIKCSEISQAINTGSDKPDSSDSTVVDTISANAKQDKPRNEISLKERFEQERERNAEHNERGTSRTKWSIIIGAIILLSALGYQFFIAGSGSSKAEIPTKGMAFKEVKIGNQIWMAENLNVSTFRNGDPIPEAKTAEEWKSASENKRPAWCYYDNDQSNGSVYGKLYNWYTVNDTRGLSPEGWHIPTDAEWTRLTNYLGGELIAADRMKSKSGWQESGNGTNESGFTALPGGVRGIDGTFVNIGQGEGWWSSSEDNTGGAFLLTVSYKNPRVREWHASKDHGFSIRCIKN
jgi:uncharacterized protein (TIGR02145 family)